MPLLYQQDFLQPFLNRAEWHCWGRCSSPTECRPPFLHCPLIQADLEVQEIQGVLVPQLLLSFQRVQVLQEILVDQGTQDCHVVRQDLGRQGIQSARLGLVHQADLECLVHLVGHEDQLLDL